MVVARTHPVCCLIVLAAACGAHAQEVKKAADEKAADEKAAARQQRLDVMKSLVKQIQVFESRDGEMVELQRSPDPVTRFNDNAREYKDGTLWAFGRGGRPRSLMTCFTNDQDGVVWWHANISLSSSRLRCTQSGQVTWSPLVGGLKLQELPKGPTPAATSVQRRQQIRNISRRFAAWQFWDPNNQRFDLRRLARPVLQYRDKEAGVVEGALFLFTHGVNPELVLLIELKQEDGKLSWQYAVSKIGSAEFHATLDDREVYQSGRAPSVVGLPFSTYHMFRSYAKDREGDEEKNR